MENEIKIGDLITTYFKGYYTLIEIEDRGKRMNPLAKFKQVADSSGKSRKSTKTLECDMSYCGLASHHIKAEIEKKKNEIDALEKLL